MPSFPPHEFEGDEDTISCRAPVHGGASICGYTRDSDVHQLDRTEVTVRRAVPLRPTEERRRKPVPWSDLPIASRLVIALAACGAVPIFAALVATLVALILRAGGLI